MNETTHDQLQEVLTAYALDALEPDEARLVTDHLRDCAQCSQELVRLRETLGFLAFSVPPAIPSPMVRAALFDRVEQLATSGAATTPVGGTNVNTPSIRPVAAPIDPAKLAHYRGRSRGAWVALTTIAAVFVLGLLGWGILTQLRLNTERQQLAAERERNSQLAAQTSQLAFVSTLLHNPNAAFPVSGPAATDYGLPAAGYIYVEPTSTVGLMLTYWLPKIDNDQRFQVWLVTPDGQRDSGGLFTADARGNAQVIINAPAPFAKYKSVGVTVEPAAGSPGPTSPRVCGGEIR